MISSAALTIAILVDPDSGAVFSKSKWRFIGTILGGIVFLLLAIPFIQAPWLFILGLAIWTGICYYTSKYYRYFQAYGALLAGYTATILLTSMNASDNVFLMTIERVTEISLGVACVAVVFGLTHLRKGIARLEPEMHLQARRIFDMAKALNKQPTEESQARLIRLWVRQTDSLQRRLLMLGEEEGIHAKQAKSISLSMMDLFAPIAQFNENFLVLANYSDNPACQKARDAVLNCLDAILPNTSAQTVSQTIKNQLPELREPLETAAAEIKDSEQRAKVSAIFLSLQNLLDSIFVYRSARHDPTSYPIRNYGKLVEQKVVISDAVGVTVGYLLVCFFWIGSAWTYGGHVLFKFLTISMLQLATDRPLVNIIEMLKGFILAFIVIFFVKFWAFPMGEDFLWLIFWLGLSLLPGCWLKATPQTTVIGTGYLLFSGNLLVINNNMIYDVVDFLNIAMALVISLICALSLGAVLHPRRAENRLDLLVRRALDDFDSTLWAVRQEDNVSLTYWEDRQFARIRQLDNITMIRRPELLDHAAIRLLQMTVAMRRFVNEINILKSQGELSNIEDLKDLFYPYTKHKPSNNIEIVAAHASAIAQMFERLDELSRLQAWALISQDLSRFKRYIHL
jgi:uncharacterized membrane protein YccC